MVQIEEKIASDSLSHFFLNEARQNMGYYKNKNRASGLVDRSIKDQKLIRPGCCEDCGDECKPHGHHPDYSKPFEVEWLCVKCHMKAHKKGWKIEKKRVRDLLRTRAAM